ncbi:MAG: hypothetical protein M3Y42_11455 [Actinomycetota bacterium]|nr:hypothetical protein [Actinomycetota bacterium]MDQ2957569.1 hypothetical protein [Actinomycetota bacterium]
MSALSDLLNEANSAGLSARSLARNAQAAGFSLNHDTAARYLRGDHGRPDEATLLALAKVFRIPLGRLRAAASLPAEETEPYRPPVEASRLNRRQRRAVDEVIRSMLDQAPRAKVEDLEGRRTRRTPTKRTAAAKPTGRAARRGKVEPTAR